MNNEPDYKDNLYFERTNKMDININTNDLLKNEVLGYKVSDKTKSKMSKSAFIGWQKRRLKCL